MTDGLVSIIIPCYNAGRYLRRALHSVTWQTSSAWECIIVDDGSTDDTRTIAEAASAADSRFWCLCKEHSGLAATRNAGIDAAAGEFLQFLDADDILLKEKLELCVGELRRNDGLDTVYTDYAFFKSPSTYFQRLTAAIPAGDVVRGFLFDWDESFQIPVHAFMFRSRTFKHLRFDASLGSHAEDVDCWIRLALAGTRFGRLDTALVVYCETEGSASSQGTTLLSAKMRLLEKYRKDPACSHLQEDFDSALGLAVQRLAAASFREKKFRQGWELMIRTWPTASASSRVKMTGWLVLMRFFSLGTIVRLRDWIFDVTSLRWGGWASLRSWNAPVEVRELLGSAK